MEEDHPTKRAHKTMRRPKAILVVEDEAMLRMLAVETLEERGFEVLAARDGLDALAFLKGHSEIALLITDIRMPRMDGYSLVAACLNFRPELKVILMTGYAHAQPAVIAAQKLKTFYKPFDLEDLCATAAGLLAEC